MENKMDLTAALDEVFAMGFAPKDVRHRGELCGNHIVRAVDPAGVVEWIVLSPGGISSFHATFIAAEEEARYRTKARYRAASAKRDAALPIQHSRGRSKLFKT